MFTARGPRLNRVTSLDNQTGWYGREQEWAGQGRDSGRGMAWTWRGVVRRKYRIKEVRIKNTADGKKYI